MMDGLNEKQLKFCNEYLVDLNATQAAIRAGYSEKTAYSQGQRLLKHVEVQKIVQKLKQERSKRLEITQDRVLEELASIAFANMADYARIVEEEGQDLLGNPVTYKKVDFALTEDLSQDQTKAIASIKEGRNGIELKMHDKLRALEKLGEHLGMWRERTETDATEDKIGKLFAAIGGALDELE